MTDRKRSAPTRLGDVISSVLGQSGASARLQQASVITCWPSLVGDQIARVTHPISISRQGVLVVAVKTNSWMTELSLLEPELLRVINEHSGSARVEKIRWERWR
jgi:predicted nucleic acid-binding Zn ribbon protein